MRHAQSDTRIREDAIRPLTPQGLADAKRISDILMSLNISKIFSSPYLKDRNIKALLQLKKENEGLNVVVGTHGTALGTMINYYDTSFGYEHFWSIVDRMPYIMHFQYQDEGLVRMQEIEAG